MSLNQSPEDLERILNDYYATQAKGVAATKEQVEALKEATGKTKEQTKELNKNLKAFGTSLLGLFGGDIKKTARRYDETVEAGGNVIDTVLSKFGTLGKLLGLGVKGAAKYVQAVNKQADALRDTYEQISRAGLTGADGMTGVFSSLQKFGYTVEEIGEFASMLKDSSTTLAQFGGTASRGAAALSNVASDIHRSEIGRHFQEMGISVDNQNKGIAAYLKIQTMTGRSQKMTQQQLSEGAAEYIEQTDRLAKITGMNAQEQEDARVAALKEVQFGARIRGLKADADKAEQKGDTERARQLRQQADTLETVNLVMAKQTPHIAKGFRDISSGVASSEDAQKYLRSFPQTAKLIQSKSATTEQILESQRKEAQKHGSSLDKMRRMGKAGEMFVDGAEQHMLATTEDITERIKQANAEKKVNDKATTALTSMAISQRNTVQSFESLVNTGIDPVTEQMSKLSDIIGKLSDLPAKLMESYKEKGAWGTVKSFASGGMKSFMGGADHPKGPSGPSEKGVKPDVLSKKEKLEGIIGKKLTITSGYRAGAANHGSGDAIDLGFGANKLTETDKNKIFKSAIEMGFTGIGAEFSAPGGAHIHLDTSHSSLTGWGSNYKSDSLRNDSPYLASLIEAKRAGKELPKVPGAATGGILSGPTSGFAANLHGTEAVVPLPDGETIPVEMGGASSTMSAQTDLLMEQLATLETMVANMVKQNSISTKILQRTS